MYEHWFHRRRQASYLGKNISARMASKFTKLYSRSIRSAREAAAFTTSSNVYEDAAGVLSESDVLFLQSPTGGIRPTYATINYELESTYRIRCKSHAPSP